MFVLLKIGWQNSSKIFAKQLHEVNEKQILNLNPLQSVEQNLF